MTETGAKTSASDIGHEWDGDPTTWPRHKLRLDKFKNAHEKNFAGFPWFFQAADPKDRGRIEEDYTVPEPDSDDEEAEPEITGAEPGTKIKKETAPAHKKACRLYKKANSNWFVILAASIIGGEAEETVNRMQMNGNEDGKLLEDTIRNDCETKSNQHASHLFKKWVTEHKSSKETITEHNRQWNRTLDVINKNLDWETMQSYLYLMSLGPAWTKFYDHMTTTNGDSNTTMRLSSIQKAAVDWNRTHSETGDEGKAPDIALVAQTSTRGTQRQTTQIDCNHPDWLTVPCAICPPTGNTRTLRKFHCARDCFDGGLSHLTDDEKGAWIRMKREAKEKKKARFSNNNNHTSWYQREQQQQGSEQANLATQVETLKRQLNAQQKVEAQLIALSAKAQEHGLENEYEPIIKKTRLYLSDREDR